MGVAVLLASCSKVQNNEQKEEATTEKAEPMVGGEKDEHGCIAAAGYTWSELLQTCVQVFEAGTRLNPVEVKPGEAVISAFVITKDGADEVEIFTPSDEDGEILKKTAEGNYTNGEYEYRPSENSLYISGVKKYTK